MRVNWLWIKCARWENQLELMAMGLLPERQSIGMKGHLSICPACAARLNALRKLNSGLAQMGKALPQVEPSEALSRRWQQVVLRESAGLAKRREPGKEAQSVGWLDAWFAGGRAAWVAAAACWLLIAILRFSAPDAPKPASAVRVVTWTEMIAFLEIERRSGSPSSSQPEKASKTKPETQKSLPHSEIIAREEKV